MWKDLSTYRGRVKEAARELVQELGIMATEEQLGVGGYNQAHEQQIIRSNVQDIIKNKKYIAGPKDEQVSFLPHTDFMLMNNRRTEPLT